MTQEEKIKDLEQRLALMDADNSALAVELAHFKKVAAGAKGRNKQLAEQIKHYKELDLEGDHLYEDKIKELEDAQREIQSLRSFRNDLVPIAKVKELEKSIENKNQFIEQLQEKVQELKIQLCEAESKNDSQKPIIDELEETVNKLSKPWWRKLF
jgi:chromosome segregation ATPase